MRTPLPAAVHALTSMGLLPGFFARGETPRFVIPAWRAGRRHADKRREKRREKRDRDLIAKLRRQHAPAGTKLARLAREGRCAMGQPG